MGHTDPIGAGAEQGVGVMTVDPVCDLLITPAQVSHYHSATARWATEGHLLETLIAPNALWDCTNLEHGPPLGAGAAHLRGGVRQLCAAGPDLILHPRQRGRHRVAQDAQPRRGIGARQQCRCSRLGDCPQRLCGVGGRSGSSAAAATAAAEPEAALSATQATGPTRVAAFSPRAGAASAREHGAARPGGQCRGSND
jgi:hypothetical protein